MYTYYVYVCISLSLYLSISLSLSIYLSISLSLSIYIYIYTNYGDIRAGAVTAVRDAGPARRKTTEPRAPVRRCALHRARMQHTVRILYRCGIATCAG